MKHLWDILRFGKSWLMAWKKSPARVSICAFHRQQAIVGPNRRLLSPIGECWVQQATVEGSVLAFYFEIVSKRLLYFLNSHELSLSYLYFKNKLSNYPLASLFNPKLTITQKQSILELKSYFDLSNYLFISFDQIYIILEISFHLVSFANTLIELYLIGACH